MGSNSKRELIILNIVETLESISWVNTVQRIRPYFNERDLLIEIDESNIPLISVVGMLPVPDPRESKLIDSGYAFFTSNLTIDIGVYILASTNYDSQLSSYVDDMWVELHRDLRRDDNALMTRVVPEMETELIHPYVIFNMQTIVTYQHGVDGI